MRRYASLRGRREFATVVRRGAVTRTVALVVFALAPPAWAAPRRASAAHGAPRRTGTCVGIVITKKVGTAVERNRLRRRCKAVLDALPVSPMPMWYVVQLKPSAAALPFAQLRDALHEALRDGGRPAGRRQRSVESQAR